MSKDEFDFDSYEPPYLMREPDQDFLAFFQSQPTFYETITETEWLGRSKSIGCEYRGNVYEYDTEGRQLTRTVFVDCRVEFTKRGLPRILDSKEPPLRPGRRKLRFSLQASYDFENDAENFAEFSKHWAELIAHIERFKLERQLVSYVDEEAKTKIMKI